MSELRQFLSTYFSDSEPDQDEENVRVFIQKTNKTTQEQVVIQLQSFMSGPDLSLMELGTETNRWFSDLTEAQTWLKGILDRITHTGLSSAAVVKDSNGTPLSEGDSVQVIKDLKVKGGSSDLKRGTLIKKIHLVDDPEVVECRVDGSTLVLKVCFVKKA